MQKLQKKIGVLGLGHVGLPTCLGLAKHGHEVLGSDIDSRVIASLTDGEPTFYENGVKDLLKETLNSGTFKPVPDIKTVIEECDVIFTCVGTPQSEDGSADLTQLEEVIKMVDLYAKSDKLIVQKSTVPVCTAQNLQSKMTKNKKGRFVEIAANPEFLREGTGLHDFLNPDRIVIGVTSENARDTLVNVYSPLLRNLSERPGEQSISFTHEKFLIVNPNTAEVIKHASNSFLATKLSFINCVADICEATGADVLEVSRGIGMDPRIGTQYMQAGLGYGGHCLPKDTQAFVHTGEKYGVDMSLINSVISINNQRINRVLNILRKKFGDISNRRVTVWGLSFKPDTDDVRDSMSISLVQGLIDNKCRITLHDPLAIESFKTIFPEHENPLLEYQSDIHKSAKDSDALIIATNWNTYKDTDFKIIRNMMSVKFILDTRNLLNPEKMKEMQFEYYGTGRGT